MMMRTANAQDNTNSTSNNNGTTVISSSTGGGVTDVIINDERDEKQNSVSSDSDRERNMIDAGLAALIFLVGMGFAIYYCVNYNKKKKLKETQSIEQKTNELRLHDSTFGPVVPAVEVQIDESK